MSMFAKISFNGRFLCNFPVEKLGLINEQRIKKYYVDTLTEMLQDAVASCFSELLVKASRGTKPGGEEIQLIEALKKSISIGEQMYIGNAIGILNLEVLDKLLMIRSGRRKGVGWWRVLESKQDIIRNNDYMFIPKRGAGKFKEGFLLSREHFVNSDKFRPHTYSVKDKRYITKFLKDITEQTLDNEIFMDNVMTVAVSKMLYNLNLHSGDGPQ